MHLSPLSFGEAKMSCNNDGKEKRTIERLSKRALSPALSYTWAWARACKGKNSTVSYSIYRARFLEYLGNLKHAYDATMRGVLEMYGTCRQSYFCTVHTAYSVIRFIFKMTERTYFKKWNANAACRVHAYLNAYCHHFQWRGRRLCPLPPRTQLKT